MANVCVVNWKVVIACSLLFRYAFLLRTAYHREKYLTSLFDMDGRHITSKRRKSIAWEVIPQISHPMCEAIGMWLDEWERGSTDSPPVVPVPGSGCRASGRAL